jgi:hypothetical protein
LWMLCRRLQFSLSPPMPISSHLSSANFSSNPALFGSLPTPYRFTLKPFPCLCIAPPLQSADNSSL